MTSMSRRRNKANWLGESDGPEETARMIGETKPIYPEKA